MSDLIGRVNVDGQRATIFTWRPIEPLRPSVRSYRVFPRPEVLDRPSPCRIRPDRSSYLIAYRLVHPGCVAGQPAAPGDLRVALVGPRSRFIDIERRGRAITLIAELRAGVLEAVIGGPANAMVDVGVSILDFDTRYQRLVDALTEAADVRGMMRALNGELPGLIPPPKRCPTTDAALRFLSANPETRIADLAGTLGVSDRKLRRLFTEHVGLNAKRYVRVLRLERVLRRAGGSGATNERQWGQIAHWGGYADHSHMLRDARELLGETPQQFVSRGG